MTVTTSPQDPSTPFWSTRYGIAAAVPTDNMIARSLKTYGEWTEQTSDLLSALVDERHVVLEFGAEYAAHALWMSRAVGPGGQVHMVEPRRIRFQQSCATIALNGLDNVFAHAVWLGGSRGPHILRGDGRPDESVRGVTLDSLRLASLQLLKINETDALIDLIAGGVETLKTYRPLIYARLSGSEKAAGEVEAIKALGYRVWSHLPYLFNRENHAGVAQNLFPGVVQQNVIAASAGGNVDFTDLVEL
ncbi:MAG: hypothetical protein AAGC76_17685 [Luteibacter sp.]|jgi:hypothetical protein|uniref:hypothetical protein n=1 Tax=unclassified Luteibacter TaxID=2620188 RepID=UPI0005BA1F53|nr:MULTISPECIES: hypothetical protein [unclassified Luteibacter]MDQ7997675.1 hypothetical protein [Luteibacter sp.]MDQ8049592.1 hypothetical protein [Luteibacter sp.]